MLDSYADDRFAIAEIHESDWEVWASYYQAPSLDSIHMPFNFSLLFAPWDAEELRQSIEAAEAAVPEGAGPITCWETTTRPGSPHGSANGGRGWPQSCCSPCAGRSRCTTAMRSGCPRCHPPGEIRDPQGIRLGTRPGTGAAPRCNGTTGPHAGFSPRRRRAPGCRCRPTGESAMCPGSSTSRGRCSSSIGGCWLPAVPRRCGGVGSACFPRHRDVWSIEGPLRVGSGGGGAQPG